MMNVEPLAPLPNTGERMIPELTDEITFRDHIARYRFASGFVRGKRVLDIACGEGYGSAALTAAGASQVIGIDIAPEVVAHARRKYGVDARVGRAERIDLPDRAFDVVVSFETIEHLTEPTTFLREIARVLSPGGLLILSTPNKQHSQGGEGRNPFHEVEMTEDEFRGAMEEVFGTVRYFSQVLIEAPLFSARALAALHTRPRFRLLSGPIFRLRRWLCSEGKGPPSPEIRADPVRAITEHRPTLLDQLFEPGLVRPMPRGPWDFSKYFLAVASDPRPTPVPHL
jgi:SAM-dependent methyltransferase